MGYENHTNIWTTAFGSPHAGDANRKRTKNAEISDNTDDIEPAASHDAGTPAIKLVCASANLLQTEHTGPGIAGTGCRQFPHSDLDSAGDRWHAQRRRWVQPAIQPLRRRYLDNGDGSQQPT